MKKVLEYFQRDVTSHSMEVLHDDGDYRHLKFTNNGSQCYRFDLITWPGYLTITGDMGTYTFSRVRDMFTFFRADQWETGINPGYWAEKLQAGPAYAQRSVYMEWDQDAFKKRVCEEYRDWLGGKLRYFDPEDLADLKDEIRTEVLDHAEFEATACVAVQEFHHEDARGLFADFLCDLGNSCHRYQFHYLWCLYAIVWGIQQHDQLQAKGDAA